MKRLVQVDQYIEKKSSWNDVLNCLRDILADTELAETIKWGAPVYTLDGKNILGLGAFKSFAGIWFFQGALLKDPNKVLVNAQEGKTKALRQWRFGPFDEVPTDQVKSYIEEAINNHKMGRSIKPEAAGKKPLVIPHELQEAFAANSNLQKKFDSLSLTKQREFSEHLISAKKAETRLKRLEKILEFIIEGKGLYDKYK